MDPANRNRLKNKLKKEGKYVSKEEKAQPLNPTLQLPPLLDAAGVGDLKRVARLIKNDKAVVTDGLKNTALHIACAQGQLIVVRYLVEKYNFDPLQGNLLNISALYVAVINGRVSIMEYFFVTRGISIDIPDKNHKTPLFCSTVSDQPDAVVWLMHRNACLPQDIKNRTVLHVAAAQGSSKVVKRLVDDPNIDTTMRDDDGYTAFQLALQHSHPLIAKHIKDKRALSENEKSTLNTFFLRAISESNSLFMKSFLTLGPDTTTTDPDSGFTAVHLAAVKGQRDMMEDIFPTLPKGFLDTRNRNGDTALHLAADHQQQVFAQYLVEAKADTLILDKEGLIPFERAVKNDEGGSHLAFIQHWNTHMLEVKDDNTAAFTMMKRCAEKFNKTFLVEYFDNCISKAQTVHELTHAQEPQKGKPKRGKKPTSAQGKKSVSDLSASNGLKAEEKHEKSAVATPTSFVGILSALGAAPQTKAEKLDTYRHRCQASPFVVLEDIAQGLFENEKELMDDYKQIINSDVVPLIKKEVDIMHQRKTPDKRYLAGLKSLLEKEDDITKNFAMLDTLGLCIILFPEFPYEKIKECLKHFKSQKESPTSYFPCFKQVILCIAHFMCVKELNMSLESQEKSMIDIILWKAWLSPFGQATSIFSNVDRGIARNYLFRTLNEFIASMGDVVVADENLGHTIPSAYET